MDLAFRSGGGRTVLARNHHEGPLLVQKALYPEGPEVCQVVVLHPPGGIAAGDDLSVRASLEGASRALLTTPGATKWYRSEREWARQRLKFSLGDGAVLEWLPRENIVFDGAKVSMSLEVELSGRSRYVGWEILSFGRRASGEPWRRGSLGLHTSIRRADRPLWSEIGSVDAGSGFAASVVGLAGFTVCGMLVVAGHPVDAGLMAACREVLPKSPLARFGVTGVPEVMVARYLGDSAEEGFDWFTRLWAVVRPALLERAASMPRVWAC